MWSFDIPETARRDSDDLKQVLVGFLVEDFIERHIRTLFDFEWNAGKSGGQYRGVMTYFQLDQLFNSVFDQYAHPHLFLNGRPGDTGDDPERRRADTDRIRRDYDVQHLIRAISLSRAARQQAAAPALPREPDRRLLRRQPPGPRREAERCGGRGRMTRGQVHAA
ncbi:MAG: hypothetical protein GEV11_13275 [Streptosporangiales bacterium]|nr:hypothetical protein [Streptosporangiales bacterium]